MGLAVGTRLGVFTLRRLIGAGGMGEVWEAVDTRLDRIVAIKVPTLQRPDAQERFQREAKLIAQLKHRHICTIHDVGEERPLGAGQKSSEEKEVAFLVMEYVEGETLSARLARGRLDVHEAIAIARDVAGAVDYAHRRRVIHRDLKPSNIVLTRESGAKLLDFGLAKLHRASDALGDGSTQSNPISHDGAVIGTLRYMAPEVLEGKEADSRSDVFSLGAVFYEMLAGEAPFRGPTTAQIALAIGLGKFKSLLELRPDVPATIDSLISTCLAPNPDERCQSAGEIVRQLKPFEPGHLSPLTPTPMPPIPRARPRRVAMVAFGSVIASIALVLAMLIGRPSSATMTRAFGDPLGVPHVVVLPCRTIGEVSAVDRAQCDGMAATLTAMLAKLTTKHVLQVSPTSEVHSRKVTTATEARRQLGATLALEGSLMRNADGMRVTYALVDAGSARQIDALALDGGALDAFRIQDALAAWAVDALRLTLDATEQITERRGTQSTDAYAFALQGRGYLVDYQRAGAIDIAISLFRRALEADPKYAVAHGGLGEAYWRKFEATKDAGLVDQARASCRQALSFDAELAASYVCSGIVASGTGEHEEAIAFFERALKLDGSNDDAYRLMAYAQEQLGRTEAALATFSRAVELRPQYWATHVWLANFHRTHGNYPDATRGYERAVELTPDNAPVRAILAGLYSFLGRYEEAVAECERAIAITPSHLAYNVLGGTQYRLRRFDDAVVSLEKARALGEDFRTVGNLGRAYYWSGQKDRARAAFERAVVLGQNELAVNPRDESVHVALADYHARLGHRREALDHLGRSRMQDPHFMFFAAMVHNQLGDAARGRQWLEKARAGGVRPAEINGWIDVDNLRR